MKPAPAVRSKSPRCVLKTADCTHNEVMSAWECQGSAGSLPGPSNSFHANDAIGSGYGAHVPAPLRCQMLCRMQRNSRPCQECKMVLACVGMPG